MIFWLKLFFSFFEQIFDVVLSNLILNNNLSFLFSYLFFEQVAIEYAKRYSSNLMLQAYVPGDRDGQVRGFLLSSQVKSSLRHFPVKSFQLKSSHRRFQVKSGLILLVLPYLHSKRQFFSILSSWTEYTQISTIYSYFSFIFQATDKK